MPPEDRRWDVVLSAQVASVCLFGEISNGDHLGLVCLWNVQVRRLCGVLPEAKHPGLVLWIGGVRG